MFVSFSSVFPGRAGIYAAFCNVLFAAAGGLDHLVARAALRVDVAIAKTHGDIEDQLSELKRLQAFITAMQRNEFVRIVLHYVLLCPD